MATNKKEMVSAGMTAMQIADEIRSVINAVIEQDGEMTPEQNAELTQLDMAMDKKLDSLCFVKKQLESEQAYFEAIKAAAEAQIKKRERAVDNLKAYMANVMKAAEIKSVKGEEMLHSISLVKGRTKTVIDDVNKLDFNLTEIVTTIKPKTDEIKKALEAGETVSGAHLETGADYVMIRG